MIRGLTLALLWSTSAAAQGLQLPPTAIATTQTAAAPDQLPIAIAPFEDGKLPQAILEGVLTRSVWKVTDTDETTLAMLLPLVVQLEADGYTKTFSCADTQCGGFEFRFALDVLPPPQMQVNLADFQYWTGTNDIDHVTLLVSRIASTAYIQIDRIGTAAPDAAPGPAPKATFGTRTAPESLIAALEVDGRVILPGLVFAPGSSSLSDGGNAALATLADMLLADPSLKVALVGHTDTAGSLDGNIALSKRRAQSVRARLIDQYNVPPGQMAAEGMGYLAPVASNRTGTGREANRRVEVILLNTD